MTVIFPGVFVVSTILFGVAGALLFIAAVVGPSDRKGLCLLSGVGLVILSGASVYQYETFENVFTSMITETLEEMNPGYEVLYVNWNPDPKRVYVQLAGEAGGLDCQIYYTRHNSSFHHAERLQLQTPECVEFTIEDGDPNLTLRIEGRS